MEQLKIIREKNFKTNQEVITKILYGDKVLSSYNKDIDKIDFSVLNPFINKNAILSTIDKQTNKIIEEVQIKILSLNEDNSMVSIDINRNES